MIILHNSFIKDYKKLSKKIKEQFKIRRNIFLGDKFSPILNNHELRGEYSGCRSINIDGNFRAIYYSNGSRDIFIRIGTHHQLYGK